MNFLWISSQRLVNFFQTSYQFVLDKHLMIFTAIFFKFWKLPLNFLGITFQKHVMSFIQISYELLTDVQRMSCDHFKTIYRVSCHYCMSFFSLSDIFSQFQRKTDLNPLAWDQSMVNSFTSCANILMWSS